MDRVDCNSTALAIGPKLVGDEITDITPSGTASIYEQLESAAHELSTAVRGWRQSTSVLCTKSYVLASAMETAARVGTTYSEIGVVVGKIIDGRSRSPAWVCKFVNAFRNLNGRAPENDTEAADFVRACHGNTKRIRGTRVPTTDDVMLRRLSLIVEKAMAMGINVQTIRHQIELVLRKSGASPVSSDETGLHAFGLARNGRS